MSRINVRIDVIVALLLILLSAVIYWAALDLPEPKYEPLGSAALPMALAGITIFLSLILLVRTFRNSNSTEDEGEAAPTDEVTPRPKLAAFCFVMTVLFVMVLDFEILSYIPAGILYLSIIGFALNHRDVKKLPWIFGFSCILIVFTYYIFTQFFYVDLP